MALCERQQRAKDLAAIDRLIRIIISTGTFCVLGTNLCCGYDLASSFLVAAHSICPCSGFTWVKEIQVLLAAFGIPNSSLAFANFHLLIPLTVD